MYILEDRATSFFDTRNGGKLDNSIIYRHISNNKNALFLCCVTIVRATLIHRKYCPYFAAENILLFKITYTYVWQNNNVMNDKALIAP